MYLLIMVIHVIASCVLILVILMQAGRGGGVSDVFGGSSNQTIFGTSTGQFLTRATAVCAVLFIISSLSLAVLSSRRAESLMKPDAILPAGVNQIDTMGEQADMPIEADTGLDKVDARVVTEGAENSLTKTAQPEKNEEEKVKTDTE